MCLHLKSVLYSALLTIFFLSYTTISAQDDLYGDKPNPAKSRSPRTSSRQSVGWNDPVTGDASLLFISRKNEPHPLPVSIFVNNKAIGNLNKDSQFNYTLFTQGKTTVKVVADGITRQIDLDVQKGKKYFIEVSAVNHPLIMETEEDYALRTFRPSSVMRFSEKTITSSPARQPGRNAGILISKDGYILTSYRPVAKVKNIRIKNMSGDTGTYAAKIVASDEFNNIALLKAEDSEAFEKSSPNFSTVSCRKGDTIYVLSPPPSWSSADSLNIIKAVVVSQTGEKGDINSLQVNSISLTEGSPVMDKKGNVIGIVNSAGKKSGERSYITKSRLLWDFAEESEAGGSFSPGNSVNEVDKAALYSEKNRLVIIETE